MSRLNIDDRVFAEGIAEEVACAWFARCSNPANGLRAHPVLHQVPICQRCDDKLEGLDG